MTVPILDLQKRARELGRIRIGQVQPTSNGKTRPAKLDKFRLTSPSRPLLEKVAALYGGTVREWTPANGGPSQWEVLTESARLPILVPPQPVSQWYELWSGGGCKRRCDGEREIIKETPCLCAQADERLCKPTTRLNVVLRDVEGIGVFRLESHGYYAAVELPNVASFLEQAGGYVQAWLVLEERVVKREGEGTRRFMVPAIEIEGVTPGQLVSGQVSGPAAQAGRAPAAVTGGRVAIEAPQEPVDLITAIQSATTRDKVIELWRQAKEAQAPNAVEIEAAAKARVAELERSTTPELTRQTCLEMAQQAETLDELTQALGRVQAAGFASNLADESDEVAAAFVARRRMLEGPASPASGGDTDALWSQIVAAWPGDRTSEIEEAFAARYQGESPATATAKHLEEFLSDVQSGKVRPVAPALDAPPF